MLLPSRPTVHQEYEETRRTRRGAFAGLLLVCARPVESHQQAGSALTPCFSGLAGEEGTDGETALETLPLESTAN